MNDIGKKTKKKANVLTDEETVAPDKALLEGLIEEKILEG